MIFKVLVVNIITLFRFIGAIVLIPIYYLKGGIIAGIFSVICYFTDFLDGLLARYLKASTFFGAMFDGITDKLLTIVNFVLLYMITPYAIIPIIFELLTALLQLLKFNKNYNIKSNIIGKIKIWVLAFSLFIIYLVSDIDKLKFISDSFHSYIINIPSSRLFLILITPAIVIEILTFFSYVIEIFKPSKKTKITNPNRKDIPYKEKKEGIDHFKNIWLNPEFYEKHKHETNLKDLRKLSKE